MRNKSLCIVCRHKTYVQTVLEKDSRHHSYSSRHQIACFKVKSKSCNVATRTAEPRRVKTAQNSQRSKASSAVVVT
jgi:ribosomal protein L23